MSGDPYRAGGADGRRVIARRGRRALAWHVTRALAGLSTPAWVVVYLDDVPVLFLLMLLAVPLGVLDLGRAIHACFIAHTIELDERGLHVAWGSRVFAMPWLRRRDREVAWSTVRGVRVHTVSINGLTRTNLVVALDGESLEIPDDRFDRSAHLIQRAILDFVDLGRERPSASAAAERMRERFATPQRRVRSIWGLVGVGAFFGALVAYPLWLAIAAPAWGLRAFGGAAVVVFAWIVVLCAASWWRQRVLCLGPEGFSIGPADGRSRLVRWDDIHMVRRETTNGELVAIDVVEHDGTHTLLRHDYGFGLRVLARLVDPHV